MPMLEQHEHKHAVHNFDGIVENRVQPPPPYFTVLFYGLVLWGVVFCAYFLLSGWSSEEEFRQDMAAHQEQAARETGPSPGKVPAAITKEDVSGEELFAAHCAACHGAAGEGGIGPDLTASEYAYGDNSAEIRASITEGRPNGMPAFGNQLSGVEIEAIAEFVGSLKK